MDTSALAEAIDFLTRRPAPEGEDWERAAWQQTWERVMERPWSPDEARALAAAVGERAAASIRLRDGLVAPEVLAAVEARFPPSPEERAARAARGLEALAAAGRLEAEALAGTPDPVVAAFLSSHALGTWLFERAGAVLALLPGARRRAVVPAAAPLLGALVEALDGRPAAPELERELGKVLEVDPPPHTDPVPSARPHVRWLNGLPGPVRDWAWAALERMAPASRAAAVVLDARARWPRG